MSYQELHRLSKDLIEEAANLVFVRQDLFDRLDPPKQNVVIIKGARGIGKSTVIKQFLAAKTKEGARVFYFSADSIFLDVRLADIAREYHDRGGEYLAIDEIHRYPGEWQKELKTIVDSFSSLKVIVSGSSAISLDNAKADLSRRHVMIHAKGLSFREYVYFTLGVYLPIISLSELINNVDEVAHSIINSFSKNNLDLIQIFHDYLQDGYFITRNNYTSQALYFESLINTINGVIDSDLPYVYSDIDTIARNHIKSILKHIAGKCPFTPNVSQLASSLGLTNDNTLKKYLLYLNDGEILLNLYSANKSYKDFPKPQKIFLNNTNFAHVLHNSANIGTIRETFAANCLSSLGQITSPSNGDFLFEDKYIFEVGGKNKTDKQIKNFANRYVLADDLLHAHANILPLWSLGLL